MNSQGERELSFWICPEMASMELGVCRRTVRRWLNAGKIPGARRIGRQWRLPRAYVDDLRRQALTALAVEAAP